LDLLATVVSIDGSRAVYASARGARSDAAALGRHVAGQLLSDGAGEILEEVRRGQ
jgi:porphobilinogen deaminase